MTKIITILFVLISVLNVSGRDLEEFCGYVPINMTPAQTSTWQRLNMQMWRSSEVKHSRPDNPANRIKFSEGFVAFVSTTNSSIEYLYSQSTMLQMFKPGRPAVSFTNVFMGYKALGGNATITTNSKAWRRAEQVEPK